jgi:transcriptional regulator with XRE-family HTH domain
MNLQALGNKLSRYRDQLTETLDEVAAATGIDAERLRLIEPGKLEPSGDEILILADHYRCDFKFFISNEHVASFDQTDTLYRAHGRAFSKYELTRQATDDCLPDAWHTTICWQVPQ